MKLSEAIATGRHLIPGRPGRIYDGESGCAQGMALAAVGHYTLYCGTNEVWPWLREAVTLMPCGCGIDEDGIGTSHYARNHGGALAHLFDFHVFGKCDWTLDQLIDWVRSVEPAEPDSHIVEAEEFRAKHDLHPAIPAEEISEVMGLAELGLLPKICPACATKHGEQQCWGQGCQCKCQLEAA